METQKRWIFWWDWTTREILQAIFDLMLVAFTGGLWWTSCNQWHAMLTNNKQTQTALEVTERAYIVVKSVSDQIDDLQPGKIPHTTLAINNTGHTPAYHLAVVDVLEIVSWPLPATAHFKTFVSKNENTVFSGAPLGLPVNTNEMLSQKAFDNIQANVWRPCAWGTVTYETFDRWHYTNFCLCYGPKGVPAEYCPYHNDAN
jgi:hypothetical protein